MPLTVFILVSLELKLSDVKHDIKVSYTHRSEINSYCLPISPTCSWIMILLIFFKPTLIFDYQVVCIIHSGRFF